MTPVTTSPIALGHTRQGRDEQARGPLRRLVRTLRNHLRDQRQYRKLEQLPDYLLDDIGLTRADINGTGGGIDR